MNLPIRTITHPVLCGLSLVFLLSACSSAPPPDSSAAGQSTPSSKPAAASANPASDEKNTELRDAIQTPINKARAVEAQLQETVDQQRQQIDAQSGD